MNIGISEDWKLCGYDAGKDEAVILREDADWIKELTSNIKATNDRTVIRQAEHDFHAEMLQRYGGKVAGALLMKLWQATAKG